MSRFLLQKLLPLVAASLSALAFGAELRILTSSSVLGKDSFGEFLQKEFPKFCKDCHLTFQSTNEISGLLGQLRLEKKKNTKSFDAVLGLDSRLYGLALSEGLIRPGQAYDQSPMAFIADTQRLPSKLWPRRWEEVSTKLRGAVLLPDPRLSSPGFTWLLSIFTLKLQSLEASQRTVHRVFPSWTSAYSAFTKGEGKAVWSYRTSEAYHRCQGKNADEKTRYLAVPLEEGYPTQTEYFASTSNSLSEIADRFARFLVSPPVQKAIPLKNWMFPIDPATEMPECFRSVTPIKALNDSHAFDSKEWQSWTDQWAL